MGHSDFQAGFSRAEAPPLAAGVVRGVFTAALMTLIIVGLAASS